MTGSTKNLIIISTAILLVIAILSGLLIYVLNQKSNSTSFEEQSSTYQTSSVKLSTSSEESSSEASSSENSSSEVVSNESPSSESTSSKATSSKTTSSKSTSSKATSSKATSSKNTSSKATSSKMTSSKDGSSNSQNDLYKKIISKTKKLDTKRIGYGFGNDVNKQNRPLLAIEQQNEYGKNGMTAITENMDTIYLTFDEGYEAGYTDDILDTLKAKKCKATFFVTLSYVKNNPKLVKRMIKEGHVIGNHSVNHYSMPTLSAKEMISEIMGLHEYMLEHYGYEMKLFRPPTGAYSEQSLEVAKLLGYRTVEWSFAYKDWDENNQPNAKESLKTIKQKTHGGAIFLLHAVSKTNSKILGDVIDYWRKQGYSVEQFPNISPDEKLPK